MPCAKMAAIASPLCPPSSAVCELLAAIAGQRGSLQSVIDHVERPCQSAGPERRHAPLNVFQHVHALQRTRLQTLRQSAQ